MQIMEIRKNIDQDGIQEKIYIVQPIVNDDALALRDEAVSLIESAGALYAGSIFQKIRDINPATFIGPGKLQELRERLDGLDVTVLFNGELTPSQTLNISAALDNKKVIDRTTLILDIFARSARSGEGKLQVELAQLQYMYPRLKGKGEALSRLGGGIGTRGPGETKLETDRRRIRMRIAYLKDRLATLENRRELVNARRKKGSARRIALVGYTNTGKSTLLNLLTGADVPAENRLFATLDPTTRRLVIDGLDFLLTDTVGFLRDLPHNLISAFHSTLESALNCDLALIVCDATSDHRMQYETTMQTLKELECDVPCLLAMNKCESVASFDEYPQDAIFISAKENIGIDRLRRAIFAHFSAEIATVRLRVPYTRMNEYARIKELASESDFRYFDDCVELTAHIPNIHLQKFAPFRVYERGGSSQ